MEKSEKYILILIFVLLISIFILIYAIGVERGVREAQASTQISASIDLTQDNCYSTYLINKECFDGCVK